MIENRGRLLANSIQFRLFAKICKTYTRDMQDMHLALFTEQGMWP